MMCGSVADAIELDLRDVVSEAYATARRACTDRHQRLVLRVPPDPVWVKGDFSRLRQVIEELLDTASTLTKPGERIRLSLKEAGGQAVVQVTHGAIGLTPAQIASYFERSNHVRGLTPAKRRRLNRLRHSVDLHGGTIEAGSNGPRSRAHCMLRLPLAAPEGCESRTS
jgi:signal transduction histidine kinase